MKLLISNGLINLIAFVLILITLLIIYGLYKVIIINKKKLINKNINSLNTVLSYNEFKYFLNYNINNNKRFTVYLVEIDNFNQLNRNFSKTVVSTYLKKLGLRLSMYLPYGGKIAQTPFRKSFILFTYESSKDKAIDYINSFKNIAESQYNINGRIISKSFNISYINSNDYNYNQIISGLKKANLISKMNLGIPMDFSNLTIKNIEKEQSLINKDISFKINNVYNLNQQNIIDSYYIETFIDNESFINYFNKMNEDAILYFNYFLIEITLESQKNAQKPFNIKVFDKLLITEEFLNKLLKTLNNFNMRVSDIFIEIINSDEKLNDEIRLVINKLKSIGFKLLINDQYNKNLSELILSYNPELVVVTKENLEILRLCHKKSVYVLSLSNNIKNESITHIALENKTINFNRSKKRGRR